MIKVFQYKESPIQFEEVNGQVMANATSMCGALNKRFNDWVNLNQTKKYCLAITKKNGISENQLVMTRPGSPDNGGGSWIHEKLILSLSRWLNPEFALWCDDKIAELCKSGKVSLDNTAPSIAELMLQSARLHLDHEKKIIALEQKQAVNEERIDHIRQIQDDNTNELFSIALSDEAAKPIELRKQVSILVSRYAILKGIHHQSVWISLYTELEARYNIRLSAYKKLSAYEKLIEVAARIDGTMNKLHIIISDMIKRNAKVA